MVTPRTDMGIGIGIAVADVALC